MMGVVLLFLLSLWPGGQVDAIDEEVLANVVQKMTRFRFRSDLKGSQVAMAVLLTQQQCINGANFEIVVQPADVNNALIDNSIYLGNRLIVAKPSNNYHAEYRLLSGGNSSPMQTLIDSAGREAGDCIVFFSTNSPCLEKCNGPDGENNGGDIINLMGNSFNSWNANQKAFVFYSVWDPTIRYPRAKKPTRQEVFLSFKRIETQLPLYRCDNNGCYRCVTNPNPMTNTCLYGYY
ncbi:uncharacterized protein [Salvelinus alpinus]|uniref:uncharacterized protein n=1 Tax=Salvelinus alpinus TaxID=8036 RepID=UPI0039FB9627